MSNPRITLKERNLIRGALRRVYARSEIRNIVVRSAIIRHNDNSRSRVKTWVRCNGCRKPIPKSYVIIDHILPVIGIEETAEGITFDEFIDRLWCSPDNLQVLCKLCHEVKTQAENRLRREYKKRVKTAVTQGTNNEE